jgi:hypothetical protein
VNTHKEHRSTPEILGASLLRTKLARGPEVQRSRGPEDEARVSREDCVDNSRREARTSGCEADMGLWTRALPRHEGKALVIGA